MRWYVKKNLEDSESILINYSHEKNDTCDGLLRYDKTTDKFEIKKMSDGADEFGTKWLFQHLYGLLEDNALTDKLRVIAIG